MNIGFEKDLVTVGMIEREHRAADRLPGAQFLPDLEQHRPVTGRTSEVNVLLSTSACERPVMSSTSLLASTMRPSPVEHDHRIRKVVEQGTQLRLGVPKIADVVAEPIRQRASSGTTWPTARR